MKKNVSFYCNKIIELALLTLVIVTPLLFSKDTESTFLLPKEIFSKSIILFMAMVWLIKISSSGKVRTCASPLNLPLLSLILAASLSLVNLINSTALHLGLWDLSNLICFIILYFIIGETIRTREQIERLLIIFVLIGGFTALYGVLQYYGIDYFHYWIGNVGRKRMFSTLGNPNFAAEYHIAVLPLSLVFFSFDSSLWKKVIGGLGFVAAFLCLLISQTRGCWVGFFLSLIFLCILLKLKDRKIFANTRKSGQAILILALIIFLGFGIADLQKHGLTEVKAVFNRVSSILTFRDEFRRFVWQATIIMIREHPFSGVGLGGFKQRYPEYQAALLSREEYPSYVQGSNVPQAHNEFLQVWAEMGVLGIAAVMWLLIAFFCQGISTLKKLKTPYLWRLEAGIFSGCFAVIVHALASFPFHLASTASVFVPLCSLITVMSSDEFYDTNPARTKEAYPRESRLPPRWIPVGQVLIVVLIVICTVITIRPIMANIYLKIGGAFLKEKQWDTAKEYITKGISLNPHEGKLHFALAVAYNGKGDNDKMIYESKKSLETFKDVHTYHNLGTAYMKKGLPDEAITEWKKAVAVRPDLVATHMLLGKAYENKGMLKESEREYKKVIWFEPDNVRACFELGYIYGIEDKLDEAIREWEEVVRLSPDHLMAHTNLGTAYSNKGMKQEALKHIERAIGIDPKNEKLKEQYEILKSGQEKKEEK